MAITTAVNQGGPAPMSRPALQLMNGSDFRSLRESVGVSQRELSRILDVTPQFICRIERGKAKVSRKTELAVRHLANLKLLEASAWVIDEARRRGFLENDAYADKLCAIIAEQLDRNEARRGHGHGPTAPDDDRDRFVIESEFDALPHGVVR